MSSGSVAPRPFILVLAGVNGAGKSSVGGAGIREREVDWFNPDTFARELRSLYGMSVEDANGEAWAFGRALLTAAIANGENFAFETTLGANTIPRLLEHASRTHDVEMWFCGLSSADKHIERVKARVLQGGHAIPESKIRERWDTSRENLIKLLPHLVRLQVFDNSTDVEPGESIPEPVLILEMDKHRLIHPDPNDAEALARTPEWAMAIVQAAIDLA